MYTAGYLYFYKAFEIGNVSVVSATINLNTFIAIILAYLFLGLMVGLSFIGNKEKLFESNVKKFWLVISLVGILEALAMASVNFGLSVGDLVIVNPIASALSIVTISMAVIFLKEKISKIQALGILMTIVGIVMSAF